MATVQEMIAMLVANMGGKGSTSAADLNLLGNDIFGAVTGTYNEKPQLTPEQEMLQYAPYMTSLLNSPDQMSFEAEIARDIDSGESPVTIKRLLLARVANGTIPPEEEKILLDVVDTLFAEKQKYNEYLMKPKEDSFTKMNLPHKDERYDPTQIAPELFQSMLSNMQKSQSGVNSRLSAINAANPQDNAVSYKAGSPEQLKVLQQQILNEWKQSNKPWQELQPFDPNKDAANTFGQVLEKAGTGLKYNPISSAGGIFGLTEGFSDLVKGVGKDILNPDSEKESKKKMNDAAMRAAILRSQSEPNTPTVDKKQTAFNKAQVDYLRELAGAAAPQRVANINVDKLKNPITGKDVDMTNAVRGTSTKIPTINLRDPVASQQRIMELTAQKIAAGMESAGYTPANVGLLQKLMAARGLK